MTGLLQLILYLPSRSFVILQYLRAGRFWIHASYIKMIHLQFLPNPAREEFSLDTLRNKYGNDLKEKSTEEATNAHWTLSVIFKIARTTIEYYFVNLIEFLYSV